MNLVKSIVAGVLVLALAVFSLPAAEAATDWDGGRIRAEGTGVAPINTVSAAQARALARRAAITTLDDPAARSFVLPTLMRQYRAQFEHIREV